MIKGVILDVDGTLVDSNDAHTRAWLDALAEEGIHPGYEEVRRLIGMGTDKLLPRVSGMDPESERGKAISERRGEIFRSRYLPKLEAFPKTRELLERMRDGGLRLVVSSSARKKDLEPLLQLCGADDIIEDATSGSDVESSKPDPDPIHAALEDLGMAPESVLMLGDTPYDIEAARRAGVRTVALRCGGWDDAGLDGATAIYDDPSHLLERYEDSPFG